MRYFLPLMYYYIWQFGTSSVVVYRFQCNDHWTFYLKVVVIDWLTDGWTDGWMDGLTD